MKCLYHLRVPILTSRPDPTRKPPQDSVKEAVKDLATKASVKELIKQGVENLATKDGLGTLTESVDDLALNVQDLTESFDKMAYNVRAKAINKTRLRLAGTHPGGGIIPLVPLLDKEGLFVPIRWASEITDGSEAAIATWAARFGLDPVAPAGEVEGGGEVGHEVGRAEIQALTPIQRATMQRELVSRYIGVH